MGRSPIANYSRTQNVKLKASKCSISATASIYKDILQQYIQIALKKNMCLYFSHLFLHTPHFILTQKRRFGSDRLMHNDRRGGIHTAATVSLAVQGMALYQLQVGCFQK